MVVLFSNGLLYSTWGVGVPVIKGKFGLSEGILAMAMAVVAIGGILTMARAGRWISSIGSGSACVRSGLLMAITAGPILLISSYYALLLLLLVYGVATAANDIAANAQGSYLEKLSHRSLIGSLHASFSVGGLAGSLLASAWSTSGLPVSWNFFLVAATSCVAMAICGRFLQNEPQSSATERNTDASSDEVAQHPQVRRRLRLFGVLAFSALVVEGAFYDWAAVYMREVVKAPASWVGFGYAAFAVGMAIGRVLGDKVRDRLPSQAVMAASSAICISGLTVVISASAPATVVAGFWVTGVGLSNFIPMLFSSAGRLSRNTGIPASQGLAITTRIAYVGLLVGPLVIGPLAQQFGLRHSLVSLAVAVGATFLGWLYISHSSGGVPWELRPSNGVPRPGAAHR